MFYAVTDLLTNCNDMDMGRVIAIQPIYANPTPTHNVPVKIQPNPTQPNPWVDPTHVHVCAEGIYRLKYYTVTLKTRLRAVVLCCHCHAVGIVSIIFRGYKLTLIK